MCFSSPAAAQVAQGSAWRVLGSFQGNEAAFLHDLHSSPARRKAIEAAVERDTPQLASYIDLM